MATNDGRDDEQTQQNSSDAGAGADADPFSAVREKRAVLEGVAELERADCLPAAARVLLALERGERPAESDVEALGGQERERGWSE